LSKRLTYKNKYKIIRKQTEHRRKQRRLERKNPIRKKTPSAITIPNSYPNKKNFLLALAQQQEMDKEEQKMEQTFDLKRKREEKEKVEEEVPAMIEESLDEETMFFEGFRDSIDQSDVVLEVLDARDPLGTRSLSIEKQILSLDQNKKIILVLNKIDLVPKENVSMWMEYLKNFYPTILFKSSIHSESPKYNFKKKKKKRSGTKR